ncbi:MAG: cation-translocating P-type ATPase [Betaproteobacteria bacterium]
MALHDPAVPDLQQPVDWHALTVDTAEAQLETDRIHGLGAAEAARRAHRFGANRLSEHPGTPLWRRFLDQFKAPLVLVLIAAGTITAMLSEWPDASVIFGVVLLNAIVGVWQEARAEGALKALARTLATPTTVLRDGHRHPLAASGLTVGDVVLLGAGDRVPADLRLFRVHETRIDESALTGESLPVPKHAKALPADTGLGDRANMAYGGTAIVTGHAAGFVVAIGDATETGRISGLIASAPTLATPLTLKMAIFSNWLLWAIGFLAIGTMAVGLLRGEPLYEMFMAAVALAIGAIPEGLPAAVTVTLAIGVSRMAARRAIIRRLPAVETLGSTTVICSDKTGTLTENAMTVRAYWCGGIEYAVEGEGYAPAGKITGDSPALRAALEIGALCNDAGLHQGEAGNWTITGDPTEAALLVAARKGGMDEAMLRAAMPRRDELPFDARRQYMATLHETTSGTRLLAKGALERLLPRCAAMLDGDGSEVPLDTAAVEIAAAGMASQGMRVLVLVRKVCAERGRLADDDLHALTLAGLVGMIDPPRQAAVAAVKACQAAGIRVKMITGDHAGTAAAIARQVGISAAAVLTGRELAGLDEAALRAAVSATDVFARVEPEQKLRLVLALQQQAEVVAMTGDGVNDAPALKSADIGIAMGQGGTEVAREAAAMVLTDDNFATIGAAVEEGRGVWDNLVKFITWTLPTNFGEGLVIVAAIVAGTTLPILPLQILWINMTTAVLLGLTLAFEPIEAGVMARPPRHPDSPVLDTALIRRIVLVSLLLLAGAFGLFLRELERGGSLAEARTVAINVFVLVETLYLFNCRSLTTGFWRQGFFSNRWLLGGVALMLGLQLALTYWPPLNAVFKTAPIGLAQWLEIFAAALIAFAVVGLEKWAFKRSAAGMGP